MFINYKFYCIILALFSGFLLCVFVTTPPALAAGDASFSLSPSNGSYNVGNTLSVVITETSTNGDNVDAVEADLTYDASKLQYQSTSLTGPFTLCANNSGGGGSVSIACASSAVVNGTQSVATVNFTVLATGPTSISTANTSDIDNNLGSSVWDTNLPSVSYTLDQTSGQSGGGGSGGTGSSSNPTCSNQSPSTAPNLYQIDVTNTTATLYFSPPGDPYDGFYISFGNGTNTEGYGAQFSTGHSPGSLYYTVRELSPSTVYTFKVRGSNGCKPGQWSNTVTVLTLPWYTRTSKNYYENQQAPVIQSTITSWYQQASNYVSDHFDVQLPGVPNTGLGAPSSMKEHMKYIPNKQTDSGNKVTTNASPSMWGNILQFVSGLFRL